jgi:hypothetical protein
MAQAQSTDGIVYFECFAPNTSTVPVAWIFLMAVAAPPFDSSSVADSSRTISSCVNLYQQG